MLCRRVGARLRWFGLTDEGRLDTAVGDVINELTRVVSLTYVSNALGTVNPVEKIARRAHEVGALVVVDASQAVPQMPVDVSTLGADLVAFTGHKMCGPTGIGVLWGRYDLLAELPPFLGGGEMIETVTMQGSTYAPPPHRFEAGTPPIAEAVGLGAAVDYLTDLGMDAVREHEVALTGYALRNLTSRFGDDIRIHGPSELAERGGVLSFEVRDLHPHDLTQVFDQHGVCVRAGHHCAKVLMRELGVAATARASLYVYNDEADVDALAAAIEDAAAFFAV
jgi:cysteine desulfurase/selenocysteine lyase